jgi:hypothetical protein
MKTTSNPSLTMTFLVVFAMFTSCISSQPFRSVKGSGMPVDKKINVADFQGIEVSGGFDVILVQGNTEELTLSAQENLFEYIVAKVDHGVLKIYTENNVWPTKPMKARIVFKSINSLRVSGGGDVTCETPVNVPNLDVNISGGGDFSTVVNTGELGCHISGGGDATINGSMKNLDLELSGGGDINSEASAEMISCQISGGGDFSFKGRDKVTEASVNITGGGDLDLNLNVEKIKCSVSGGGDATLSGEASELELVLNGGGDVHAGNFPTSRTTFQVSGGSDVYVNVSDELKGNITGGGDVYYSGNPGIVSIDAKGGSEIHKQ